MPVTVRMRRTGPVSWEEEVVERTPDWYALGRALAPIGALYAVEQRMLARDPDIVGVRNLVSTGEESIERDAVWFCDPADRAWLRVYFVLRRAYWWTLREVLYRRLRMIVKYDGEYFDWTRHFRPLNPLRRLLARHGGR